MCHSSTSFSCAHSCNSLHLCGAASCLFQDLPVMPQFQPSILGATFHAEALIVCVRSSWECLKMKSSVGSQSKCSIRKITSLRGVSRGEQGNQCPGMMVSEQCICCSLPKNIRHSTFTIEAEPFVTALSTNCFSL